MSMERAIFGERQEGPISKLVGLYQMFLRRSLEHFFPDGVLDAVSDRSYINWDRASPHEEFAYYDDPEGIGVVIEWFRTRYMFQPGSPSPFLPAERKLIKTTLRTLS